MFTPLSYDAVPAAHPIVAFRSYWYDHLDDAGFFHRSSWHPMKCGPVLPWIILLEQTGPVSDPEYQYKLIGDEVYRLLSLNLTGAKVGDYIYPEAADAFKQEFQRCAMRNEPQYSQIALPIEGRDFIDVYRGVFPVVAHGEGVDQFIVVVAKRGQTVAPGSVRAAGRYSSNGDTPEPQT